MKRINRSKLSIPKNALSFDTQIAYETIFDYFSGFDIDIEETSLYYNLYLRKSDFSYCEDLSFGFEKLRIRPSDISNYCFISANSCICLSENCLPYSWRVISGHDTVTKKTAIIHIDDHSDLMKPFISLESGRFRNILSNQTDDTLTPEFLKDAIDTGAITIGSMLTTIIFSLERFNIYHLKRDAEEKRTGIVKRSFPDTIIPNSKRIGIEFQEGFTDSIYYLTSSINSVLSNLQGEEQCILHIDMDYFNNRYNGSTSWQLDDNGKDFPMDEQKQRMREIASSLKMINGLVPIKYILIGLSPSFYPAEYWEEGLCFLLRELDNSGINVQALLHKYGWDTHNEQ